MLCIVGVDDLFLICTSHCLISCRENQVTDIESARKTSTWKNDAIAAQSLAALGELHKTSVAVAEQRLSIAAHKLSKIEHQLQEVIHLYGNKNN